MIKTPTTATTRGSAALQSHNALAQAVTVIETVALPRPPKAPPPRKASCAAECLSLEQLPNIGPSIAADLRDIGVEHPQQLADLDPLDLYRQLCAHRGTRQDPCVLDTFMAAVDFMQGADQRPWWSYTAQRKVTYGAV